jgi:hypothetical protein
VSKVTLVRKQHCDSVLVHCGDCFGIALTTAWLNDQCDTSFGQRIHTVSKRKERIAGSDGISGPLTSSQAGDSCRFESILLPRADAYCA